MCVWSGRVGERSRDIGKRWGELLRGIRGGKARNKKSEVRGVVVLDAEVVHDQDKGNRARGVAEKTGGKGLVKIERLKEGDESEI